mmetsp:Transcript_58458/g.136867  ORF Transcript_58458/g.136867 Transcript_58458/m.136867 type:complete len:217 (+) Transcript_58458:166-816(+)
MEISQRGMFCSRRTSLWIKAWSKLQISGVLAASIRRKSPDPTRATFGVLGGSCVALSVTLAACWASPRSQAPLAKRRLESRWTTVHGLGIQTSRAAFAAEFFAGILLQGGQQRRLYTIPGWLVRKCSRRRQPFRRTSSKAFRLSRMPAASSGLRCKPSPSREEAAKTSLSRWTRTLMASSHQQTSSSPWNKSSAQRLRCRTCIHSWPRSIRMVSAW